VCPVHLSFIAVPLFFSEPRPFLTLPPLKTSAAPKKAAPPSIPFAISPDRSFPTVSTSGLKR